MTPIPNTVYVEAGSDETITACVCAADRYCCLIQWDEVCVSEVDILGCGTCVLTSVDCNTNGIPDECEPDCNGNGTSDDLLMEMARLLTDDDAARLELSDRFRANPLEV